MKDCTGFSSAAMELQKAKRPRQDECFLHKTLWSYVRMWLEKIAHLWPLKYLLPFLQKFFRCVCSALPAAGGALVGAKPPTASPVRPVRHAKKRLGILTRIILALLPTQLERVRSCPDTMGRSCASKETLHSLVNPSGKGSKRKQEDLCLEEHQCWVEMLLQELPDEDDSEDPTYEPTKSETDSEEYKSHNSTETDLELEDKNGTVKLKEYPTQQEDPDGRDRMATEVPQTEKGRVEGDGSEDPTSCNSQVLLSTKDKEP